MNLFFGILIGLIILAIFIVLHELGHAVVARRNGVTVEEFGIGFPPNLWKKKLKNDILFKLNWLPLGGYVKLKGEYDSARGEGTFGAVSFWAKTKILFAGVAINWLTAVLLFTILAVIGLPKIVPNQVTLPFDTEIRRSAVTIGRVVSGSPAESAGLMVGDEVVRIDSESIETAKQLSATTKKNAGKSVLVVYLRSGKMEGKTITLNPHSRAGSGNYLGVVSKQAETIHSTWSAPILGLATTGQLTVETIKGLGSLANKALGGFFGQFVGSTEQRQVAKNNLSSAGESVAGPVAILGVLFPAVIESGVTQVILLAGVISLTLAVVNALPIPALDGGRWTAIALFRLFKKKLTKEREENIQAVGLLLLLLLMVVVTWNDIGRLIG